MVDFYHRVLGFDVLSATHHQVVLGMEQRAMITFIYSRDTQRETQSRQGLFHVAYLVHRQDDFARVLNYLSTLDYPLEGLADHGVSQAIYLRDPEGNGVEIYVDRDQRDWPVLKGQLNMVTDPLNVQALLQLTSQKMKLPPSTIVGHLHLHVGDLQTSTEFYKKTFGYVITQHDGTRAIFLAHKHYHHHLGLNTWLGVNLPQKNKKTSGLIAYKVENVSLNHLEDPSGIIINPKY
jgi:catechol 2,3-dioxygenase